MKTTDIEAQKQVLERAYKESRLSEKVYNSKIRELNQGTDKCGDESKLREELVAKVQGRHFEIDLRCDCGYEGTVICGKMDFKLCGKNKKRFAYFKCPNCKRRLQYDCSTGTVKTKKRLRSFAWKVQLVWLV